MVHNDLLHGCSGNAGSHCLGVRRWNPSSEEAIQNNGQQADAGFFLARARIQEMGAEIWTLLSNKKPVRKKDSE